MNHMEQTYTQKMNLLILISLFVHFPLALLTAYFFDTSFNQAISIGLLICAGPLILYFVNKNSKIVSISLGIALMAMSALLIHLSKGLIEMHFHIFVSLAVMIIFANPWVILAAATTVAIHHVGFWYFIPSSVFNYQASFSIVLFHAFFVIIETVPAMIIADKFKKIIINQGSLLIELKDLTHSISSLSNESAVSSSKLSSSAKDQATAIQETAVSLEEVTTQVKLNTQNATKAAELSVVSSETAMKGESHLKELIKLMTEISDSSNKIKDITEIIDDIAFQTNLLALNAAVEAARAGEQGRGFAVVADAVRSLSQKSAQAAKEISQLISISVSQIEQSKIKTDQSGEYLGMIVDTVKKLKDLNKEISIASNEQFSGIEQIKLAVDRIDESTQNSSNIADSSKDSSLELENQLKKLESLVSLINAS